MDYHKPTSLTEVVRLLQQGGSGARIMGGGTDLIVQIRERRRAVDLLIDLKALPESNVIQLDERGMRLGAAVPCFRICGHQRIRLDYSALVDSASLIGGTQIQSRASLGGNICNASPAADSIPTLIALGATCVISGPQGSRSVAAEQFCTGPGNNGLGPAEFLVVFNIPALPRNSGAAFVRFIPRNEMDIAVVNAAAYISLDEDRQKIVGARLALGAVAPTPLLIPGVESTLVGQSVDNPNWEPAIAAARAAARPITDMRGSRNQRLHLSGIMAQRALEMALHRARSAA